MSSRSGPIIRAIGHVQLLSSLLVLPSLGLSLWDGDGAALAFVESFLVLFGVGLLMYLPTRRSRAELRLRDGFLVTSAVWAIMSLVMALPLMLAPPYLDYFDALFEWIRRAFQDRFIYEEHLDLFVSDPTPEGVLNKLAQFRFPDKIERWLIRE